eukprot:sb/3467559/
MLKAFPMFLSIFPHLIRQFFFRYGLRITLYPLGNGDPSLMMRSEFSSFYNLLFRSCIQVSEPPERRLSGPETPRRRTSAMRTFSTGSEQIEEYGIPPPAPLSLPVMTSLPDVTLADEVANLKLAVKKLQLDNRELRIEMAKVRKSLTELERRTAPPTSPSRRINKIEIGLPTDFRVSVPLYVCFYSRNGDPSLMMRSEFSSFYNLLFRSCIQVSEPPRRINKIEIGLPTDFRHTSHLGTQDLSSGDANVQGLQEQLKTKSGYLTDRTSYPTEPSMSAKQREYGLSSSLFNSA